MDLRNSNIQRLQDADKVFDVLVLGGGINGAVSAAALSGKGAKVALIDRDDFSGLTSSNSSNLAWGGIKYLESYEFLLVNDLCKSRNQLMRNYPSMVKRGLCLANRITFRQKVQTLKLPSVELWHISQRCFMSLCSQSSEVI